METILSVGDFNGAEVQAFYRIPSIQGKSDVSDLVGVIEVSQIEFLSEFGMTAEEVSGNADYVEALKYYTFSKWLQYQQLRRTAGGAGLKVRFTNAENMGDITRAAAAYNYCCGLLGRPDMILDKFRNF